VNGADMIGVLKRLNFIIGIRLKRILASPVKDIPEAGKKSKKNWINASCFVPIVIESFTLKVSSPQWKH
jgi:hypothetical protein